MKKFKTLVAVLAVGLVFGASAATTNDRWESNTDYFGNKQVWHQGTVERSMYEFDQKMKDEMDHVKGAFASASAMNNIPLDFNKNISVGVGVGGYKNGSAVAVAFGAHPEDTDVTFKMSAALDNKSNTTVGAGVAYGW